MNRVLPLFIVRKILDYRSLTRLTAEGKEIPKRKVFENRVTLINTDNSVSITDLINAQSLSVRRDLKLVKIQDSDSKTRRPVYKLMTNAEYHSEELNKRKEKQAARLDENIKGEKLLTLSSRIGEHDLITATKKIVKLIEKNYEVKVIVSREGDMATKDLEKIYTLIEKNIVDTGKIVQKRTSGNSLKFQILPLKQRRSTGPPSATASDENGNENRSL